MGERDDDAFERMVGSRFRERPLAVTRADALAALGSLALAGTVAARQWFGVGRSDEEDGPGAAAGESGGDSDGAATSRTDEADTAQGDGGRTTSAGSSPDVGASDPDAAGAGLYAVIQDAEGFYQVLPLWEDAQLTVESSQGYNAVQVDGGRVRVSEADCKNQICVHAGWAQYEGQLITCLPHRMVVEVVADPADASRLS